ncbi:MAG TPA: DUF2510 domain-containing protein [Ilumatobacteraceae bacterium]|nr:DUF2510 domain-containing protein [Ilumatobacteraceae bacterium]
MQEFSSVTASSYDADSLTPLLNEKAAEGWDVVSIVSAGTNIVAYLSRESGELDMIEEAAIGVGAEEAIVEETAAELVIEEAIVEEEALEVAAEEAIVEEAAAELVIEEAIVEDVAVAGVADAVDEPAGWATAPEETVAPAAETEAAPVVAAAAPVAAPEPAPAAEPAVPAGWYADPSGRYELRYWDAAAWTEHVSRAGQQFTDPPVA